MRRGAAVHRAEGHERRRRRGECPRAGRPIRITQIATRTPEKARALLQRSDGVEVNADVGALVCRGDVDIVLELIGGIEPARSLVLEAIARGKHVVTANKALLAAHGNEIFAAAQKAGVMVAFEGAVAGGIPIINSLREGWSATRIEWISVIINAPSTFFLPDMRDKGLPFATV